MGDEASSNRLAARLSRRLGSPRKKLAEEVILRLAVDGPMTAYRLATRCHFHLWSTKRTLKSLKRKGLVEATASDKFVTANDRERVRAQFWSLTRKGLYEALGRAAHTNWAFARAYENYPLYFIELGLPSVPVAPPGKVWSPELEDIEGQ